MFARANTALGNPFWLGDRTVWQSMSGMWPETQVAEDLLDDLGLLDKGDAVHPRMRNKKSPLTLRSAGLFKTPAATYSPTTSQWQYHQPRRA